ncbi:hypothetical protein ACIA74_17295 [Streptomyces sp. NPDC051658]|uniref:hypothetical protein n=1 Tax=unclassified Streptomyces TaxID=2593676 RepID=UPI0037AE527E|nr:hypothetical protein OG520_06175 [Streptomyces sp. NBC_00984]
MTWNNRQDIQHHVAAGEHSRRPFDGLGDRTAAPTHRIRPDIDEWSISGQVNGRSAPARLITIAMSGGHRPV